MWRRDFLKAGLAGLATAASGCAAIHGPARARVVVIGGGYGGATAARYVRMLDPSIEVVLIEPNEAFVSCPLSNMVLGGFRTMADITVPYGGLAGRGVRVVRDFATAVDMDRKQVRLARGDPVAHPFVEKRAMASMAYRNRGRPLRNDAKGPLPTV